jgi:hypothetical protein
MNMERIVWAAWWIGTILIALSWVNLVPVTIGWIGFTIACLSVIVSVIVHKYWLPPKADRRDHTMSERDDEDKQDS